VARWREVNRAISHHCQFLNSLPIDRLHIEAEATDLWLTLGERRKWIGGSGRNIPSFEVFTSPDWRGTEGLISFSEPLYVYGSLIKGIALEFREGKVVSARADENEDLLKQMIATEGADRIGEYSLTDARLSKITHFMADTLFDENVGGPQGNTHLAVGLGLRHCYDGDATAVSGARGRALVPRGKRAARACIRRSGRGARGVEPKPWVNWRMVARAGGSRRGGRAEPRHHATSARRGTARLCLDGVAVE
jgi:aminopeptidase